jgi:CBS domain containing-hemolysin-like protein
MQTQRPIKRELATQLSQTVALWNSPIIYGITFNLQPFIELKNKLLDKIENIIIDIIQKRYTTYCTNYQTKRFNTNQIISDFIDKFVTTFSNAIRNNTEHLMRFGNPQHQDFVELQTACLIREIHFCANYANYNLHQYINTPL